MSRTRHQSKAPGYDYWSRRPYSRSGGAIPGPFSKRMTHRLERLEGRQQARNEVEHHNAGA